MSEEERKEFLLKQADMYLSGMSYRQIAKEVGQSYVTVRDNITTKIRYVDANKYSKVLSKIEANKEKSIDDASVRERVLEAYRLLTEENKTVVEIAKILGATEFIIYRDLTKRLKMLNETAPEIVSEEMLKNVKKTLENHSAENWLSIPKVSLKESLYKLFPSERKRITFFSACALTFGINLDNLSDVLNFNKEEFRREMFSKPNPYYESLCALEHHGVKRQDIARQEFENYLQKLIKVSSTNNEKRIKDILCEVSDKKAKELIEQKDLSLVKLTDEELIVILKFQLKYLLPVKQVAEIFAIGKKAYASRIRKLSSEYQYLITDFDSLCDYYHRPYEKSHVVGR